MRRQERFATFNSSAQPSTLSWYPIINHVNTVLPRLVKQQLDQYVHEHSDLQKAIDNVNSEIKTAASKQIQEIVNDDQYHVVNAEFFKNIEQRALSKLHKIRAEQKRLARLVAIMSGAGFLLASGIVIFLGYKKYID